jgi:hypothetical protein
MATARKARDGVLILGPEARSGTFEPRLSRR